MNRKSMPRAAVALATAFVLGFCALKAPLSAQQNLAVVTTQVVSSTNASGTSSTVALDGKYSNCALTAAVSTGTVSVTINGNTQTGGYGPGNPYVANSNFGSSGVVTVSSASFTTTSGNFANTPVGAFFTWASNSGTFTAWLTCTGANAAGGAVAISSIGPVSITSIPPIVCASPACTVTTPGPAATNGTDQGINVHISGGSPAPFGTTTPFSVPIAAQGYTGTSGALVPTAPIYCNNSTVFSTTSNGPIQIAASAVGQVIYVCGVNTTVGGSSAQSISDSSSTGCGGLTALAQTGQTNWVAVPGFFFGVKTTAGHALCITTTGGTTSFIGTVYWTQASPGP